ncbi:LuxR C-terminal-related transcriptional regulator [soil metagenome]
MDTAVDALSRAFPVLAERGDVGAAARCGFWLTFMLMSRGESAQAGGWHARCGRLLDQQPLDHPGRGYLLCVTAFRLATAERRYDEAHVMADRVAAIGRDAGDDDLAALGLNIGGRALIAAGRSVDGLARLDEAMTAVLSGRLSPTVAGTVYCSLIEACEQIAELRRAHEWTRALTRWCDQQQDLVTFTGQCLTHRAAVLRRTGQFDAAAQVAAEACDRFVGAADEAATGMALYEVAEVHRVRGDLAAAEDAYRRAGSYGRNPPHGLALTRLAQGRAEAAATTLRRLLTERVDTVARIALLPAAIEILLGVHDQPAAADAAAELTRHVETYDTDALRAAADAGHGAVLLADGDAVAAAVRLRRACTAWETLGVPYEAARAHAMLGHAYHLLDDHDTAAVEFAAARRTFTTLGAAQDLARLPTDSGPERGHGLTAREHEVLRLVATGVTNVQIADDLHVAARTVDRHVANILAKLGVASRTAATAYAYEHDLL